MFKTICPFNEQDTHLRQTFVQNFAKIYPSLVVIAIRIFFSVIPNN